MDLPSAFRLHCIGRVVPSLSSFCPLLLFFSVSGPLLPLPYTESAIITLPLGGQDRGASVLSYFRSQGFFLIRKRFVHPMIRCWH